MSLPNTHIKTSARIPTFVAEVVVKGSYVLREPVLFVIPVRFKTAALQREFELKFCSDGMRELQIALRKKLTLMACAEPGNRLNLVIVRSDDPDGLECIRRMSLEFGVASEANIGTAKNDVAALFQRADAGGYSS